MTCIIGIIDKEDIYFGSDSAGVDPYYNLIKLKEPKIFCNGPFVFGYTTSFRMGQILQYSFIPPKITGRISDDKYIKTTFINSIKSTLKKHGFALLLNNKEEGGTFLLSYKNRIFKIESDYSVLESVSGFDACGCGQQIALGSLYSTSGEKNISKRILTALKAANEFSSGVCPPYHIIKKDGNNKIKMEIFE